MVWDNSPTQTRPSSLPSPTHYGTAAASRVSTVSDSVIQPACLIWRGVPARLSKEVLNKCSFNCVVNVAEQRISLTDILNSVASGVASESCNPGNYSGERETNVSSVTRKTGREPLISESLRAVSGPRVHDFGP